MALDDAPEDVPDDEPEPDQEAVEPSDDTEEPVTLGDIIRGRPVSPAAQDKLDNLVKGMTANLGKLPPINIPAWNAPKLAGLEKSFEAADTARRIASFATTRYDEHENFMTAQSEIWRAQAEAKERERQAELEWRAGLLEQQRLTVAAITSLTEAQASDRVINVWVLRVAIAALVVGIIGVFVAVLIA